MKALASQLGSLLARPNVWQHHRIAGKSLEPSLPTWRGNTAKGQVNNLGYGNNVWDWAIRSQAPKGLAPTEKVQRLSGGGLVAANLRYSLALPRGRLGMKGFSQPGAQVSTLIFTFNC